MTLTFYYFLFRMNTVKLSDYLTKYSNLTKRGICIDCGSSVQWTQTRLASHKRKNCKSVSQEETKIFRKCILDNTKDDEFESDDDEEIEQKDNIDYELESESEYEEEIEHLLE